MSDYLTPNEVCEIAPGFTANGLSQLRFQGKGPAFLKPSPRKVLYRRSDIVAWLEGSEQRITHRAAA